MCQNSKQSTSNIILLVNAGGKKGQKSYGKSIQTTDLVKTTPKNTTFERQVMTLKLLYKIA